MRSALTCLWIPMLLACAGAPRTVPVCPVEPRAVSASTPASVTVSAPAPSIPLRSEDARRVQVLAQTWRTMGLDAQARYDARPERIEWRSLRCSLPADASRSAQIVQDAAAFAARATIPAKVTLLSRSHREDERLSRAIKAGVLASGGKNRVKLDHEIGSASQIRLEVWDLR